LNKVFYHNGLHIGNLPKQK